MSELTIHMFPCLEDNYGYLLHDAASGMTAAVDTPDAHEIAKQLDAKGWRLTHIFNTHHHADHAGGNLELKRRTGCTIVGPRADAGRIPGIDVTVGEGQSGTTSALLVFPLLLLYQLAILLGARGRNGADFITFALIQLCDRDYASYLLLILSLGVLYAGVLLALGERRLPAVRLFWPTLLEAAVYASLMGIALQLAIAWFDRVMDKLGDNDVAVCLATMTASPPPWLAHRHPETLPQRADGTVLWPGGRQHFCPSSPVYREFAGRLVGRLAERYAGHPALALWHIGNEFGCHVSTCYCDTSAAAFRNWLSKRYGGVDGVNEAWSTAFWSQRYDDLEEVLPPRVNPAFANPAQQLDFQRFSSDEMLD